MWRIKTGFSVALATGAGFVASALVAYTISQSMFLVDSSHSRQVDRIASEGMELVHLTHAVLQYPGPRSIGQWQSQFAELNAQIAVSARTAAPSVDEVIGQTRNRLEVLAGLKAQLLAARAKVATGQSSPEVVGVLSAQLFQEATQLQAVLKALRAVSAASLQQAYEQARLRQVAIFLLFTLLGTLFGVALSLAFRRRVLSPLRHLEQTIDGLREGQRQRAAAMRNDEIGVICKAFNHLLDEQEADEAKLKASEARFRALVEASAQIVWSCDARGQAIEDSPSWREYTGQSLEEWLGYGYVQAIHPDDRAEVMARWQAALASGEEAANTYRLRHRSGEWRWNQARAVPIRAADGSIAAWVGMNIDIHEQETAKLARSRAADEIRQLNSELEQRVQERTVQLKAANKELEAFSYSVSHDLRAPLRALIGFAHILHDDEAEHLSADGLRLLELVWTNAGKMSTLIDDVLQFSRVGRIELKREDVDMGALARAVADDLHVTFPRAELSIAELPRVSGDASMLRQVWANLIENAFKYSSKTEQPRIVVGTRDAGGETAYFVADNGAGFDMAHAEQLFEVFQRLHAESEFPGTGAGLAIVKRIVERHGGRIWAEAQPNRGATFYFTLAR